MMRMSVKGRVACSWRVFLSACAAPAPRSAPKQPATSGPASNKSDETVESVNAAAPPSAGAAAEMEARDYASSAARPAPAAPSPDVARKEAPAAADPRSPSAGARVRLAEARRELEIATSERDCARACRALDSMERATRQVCELARSPEERRECASAGEQVNQARTKVQNACGACSPNLR